MKFRDHISRTLCLGIALACLLLPDVATAQMYVRNPPLLPNGRTPFTWPVFYFDAGARFKRINNVKFQPDVNLLNLVPLTAGDIPFGPTASGPIEGADGFPTDGSENWVYDNGFIRPSPAPVYDPFPVHVPPYPDQNSLPWTSGVISDPAGALGYQYTPDNPSTGETDEELVQYVGEFQVVFPGLQAINSSGFPETILNQTTAVEFRLDLDPLGLQAVPGLQQSDQRDATVWVPYFELGYQYSRYFNFLIGLSWFSLSESYRRVLPYELQVVANSIRDTFPFLSDSPGAWPGALFNSTTSPRPDPAANEVDYQQSYFIFPAGTADGTLPVRQILQTPVQVTPDAIRQTLANQLDLTMYEFKLGARSWYPMWGLGRFGASLGGLFAPTPYTLTQFNMLEVPETTGAIVDPNTGAVLTWPGTDIPLDPADPDYRDLIAANKTRDYWWNYGAYIAVDTEIGVGTFYAKATAEYDWYFIRGRQCGAVNTTFDPSGYAITIGGGIRF